MKQLALLMQIPTTKYCYDFHLDQLSSDKFEVYKVESLVKDVDWYAAYYAKFHKDQKDIYKKQLFLKNFRKEQRKTMIGKRMDLYGFLHGYL